MIPYALALGATPFQAGLLSSARNLLLALVQLGSGNAIRWLGSRRRVVMASAAVQAAFWALLSFVQPLFGPYAVPALIALYTLGTAAATLGGPAWGSLVADYTPPEARGRYFGRRARLVGVATTGAGFLAGGLLQWTATRPIVGFQSLCALAAAARCGSLFALQQFHDAGWSEDPKLRFSFLTFLRGAPRSNFARFSLCVAANSVAASVAAPFFAVYLLEQAGLSYASYTVVMLAGAMTGMLTSPWWGRLSDRFGNHAVLRWSAIGVSALPVSWLASHHTAWLLAANAAGAFLWGGFNLAASNFVYDASTPANRHTAIAYFNVLSAAGVSLGAFLGGALVAALGTQSATAYVAVFLLSSVLRLASGLALRHVVHEVRPIRRVGLRELVLDLLSQRLVAVLGMFSVAPEREQGAAGGRPTHELPSEQAPCLPLSGTGSRRGALAGGASDTAAPPEREWDVLRRPRQKT
jgi:MFS family permease